MSNSGEGTVVAIDRSGEKLKTKKGKSRKITIYAWVEIPKDRLKEFNSRTRGWLKHAKEQNKYYMKKFRDKFWEISSLLNEVFVTKDQSIMIRRILEGEYEIILLEDVLYNKYKSKELSRISSGKIIKESVAKKSSTWKSLMTLADNVAYYARKVYREKFTRGKTVQEIKEELLKYNIKWR